MDLLFCSLTPDMTDDELKQCIHKMHRKAVESENGFLLTVSGYDDDPRDLWDVPEVVTFFQRLIDIGFLSLLAVNAQSIMPKSPGFGAVEVWMVATGKITHRAKFPILHEYLEEVMKIMFEGNQKIAKILEEPCPKAGIKELEEHFGNDSLCEVGRHLRTIELLRGMPLRLLRSSPDIADGTHRHGQRWWNRRKK